VSGNLITTGLTLHTSTTDLGKLAGYRIPSVSDKGTGFIIWLPIPNSVESSPIFIYSKKIEIFVSNNGEANSFVK